MATIVVQAARPIVRGSGALVGRSGLPLAHLLTGLRRFFVLMDRSVTVTVVVGVITSRRGIYYAAEKHLLQGPVPGKRLALLEIRRTMATTRAMGSTLDSTAFGLI